MREREVKTALILYVFEERFFEPSTSTIITENTENYTTQ
jgi:hypothetical protein